MKTVSSLLSLVLVLSGPMSYAASSKKSSNAMTSLNSLGADDDILKRVKAYSAEQKIQVVQKRAVDRDNRIELGFNYGAYMEGDPYVKTDGVGAQADFHFNPRVSVGLRAVKYNNYLNAEGDRIYREASLNSGLNTGAATVPAHDYIQNSQSVSLNWYPIYGKLNFFDWKVAQFDFYGLAEFGQMKTENITGKMAALGAGIGVWFSDHIASRLEVKYLNYEDQPLISSSRSQDMITVNFTLGFLLW